MEDFSSLSIGLKQKVEKELIENFTELSDNIIFYEGDSLQVLDKLNPTFDLIYLDPPYETNRFFSVSSLDKTGFSDTWSDDEYAIWLNSLILKLKKILTKKGTLVLHISSDNSLIAETILNKHFKKIQKIFWKRCHGKNTVKNKFGEVVDIIFACFNTSNIFNMQYIPIEEDSVWAFKNEDKRGKYSLGALKHDRTRKGYLYSIEHEGVVYENEYGWKQNEEAVKSLIKDDRIHFVPASNNMYVKIYKHEHQGKPLSNFWDDIHSITRTSKDPRYYPTQKPQKLLERIIKTYSNDNSIILDPVCGAGTTGFVADKINRKCVLIDINEEVKPILEERFKNKIYNI